MLTDLLQTSYFAIFLIVALGFMLGRIKVMGLSLDVSAVIFIALAFGHWGYPFQRNWEPSGWCCLSLRLAFRPVRVFPFVPKQGKTLILITLLIVASACLTGVGMKYLFDIDTPSIVGLIAGALTSTPGLAVAIDSTQSPLASIAYGIAYPFGVIGVILFVKLLPKLMGIDLNEEARRLEKERRSSSLN